MKATLVTINGRKNENLINNLVFFSVFILLQSLAHKPIPIIKRETISQNKRTMANIIFNVMFYNQNLFYLRQ